MFFYEFAYRPPTSHKPSWIEADHGEDLMFTFGFPLFTPNTDDFTITEEDKEMAKQTIKYWANFAKTGYVMSSVFPFY